MTNPTPGRPNPVHIEGSGRCSDPDHNHGTDRTTEGLFRIPFIPFDRDYRLIPAEADNWDQEAIEAFYMGVEAGIGVVRARYEDHDEWRRSSRKVAL